MDSLIFKNRQALKIHYTKGNNFKSFCSNFCLRYSRFVYLKKIKTFFLNLKTRKLL